MEFQVDILLRGEEDASTYAVDAVPGHPSEWTDSEVETVLKEMLRTLDRVKNPHQQAREVFLRGISWIVEPFEGGGVLIALEIPAGAAIAGPFDIGKHQLETMITRVLATGAVIGPGSRRVH